MTLLSIFSPVYIYVTLTNSNYSETTAIISVLIFFILLFLIKLLALIYSEDLSRKIGFKSTIRLSIVPFLLYVPLMIFAADYPVLFIGAMILMGLHAGFFWWGYHGYFIKTGEKDHLGKSLGEANLLETIAAVATPFLGSLVTSLFSYSALFIVAAVFMVLSLVLLGKEADKRQKRDIEFSGVVRLIKKHKSMSFAYMGAGAETITYIVVWPIFLYLFFGKLISLGVVVSLGALFAALFATIIGAWADKQGERRVVSVGTLILSSSWIFRYFFRSFRAFVVVDAFRNFGQRMVNVPLMALSYRKGIEAESAKAILFYETTSILGVFLSLIILSLWLLLGGNLADSFILLSLISLMPLIAAIKKRLPDSHEK